MFKKIIFVFVIVLSFSFTSSSSIEHNTSEDDSAFAISLRYYNKDSKSYEFKVKSCGRTTKVKFDKSKTTTVTIQSGCSDAIIFDKCKEIKVENGDKITIKNGCITIN